MVVPRDKPGPQLAVLAERVLSFARQRLQNGFERLKIARAHRWREGGCGTGIALRQRQNLEHAFAISDEAVFTQKVTRAEIRVRFHFEHLADARVIIKTHAALIGNGDEKIVQEQFFLRHAAQKVTMQEVVVYPAEGAVADVANTLGYDDIWCGHGFTFTE